MSGVRAVCWLALVGLACGGTSPPPQSPTTTASRDEGAASDPVLDAVLREESLRRAPRHAPESRPARSSEAARAEAAPSSVGVRGITGSLTAYEVEQAMSARHEALLACVQDRPRALGHVAGNIAFHVDVDGQGKVERVEITESDLGYTPLEACLSAVVAATAFPVPAGAQRAEAQWRMGVDPLQRAAEWTDPADLEPVIERHAESAYERCSVDRRQRFVVNGYVARTRKLRPVSVRIASRRAPRTDADTVELLTCLSHELEQWTGWPKTRGVAKVGFELRWVAAPAPKRGRTRTHAKRR